MPDIEKLTANHICRRCKHKIFKGEKAKVDHYYDKNIYHHLDPNCREQKPK